MLATAIRYHSTDAYPTPLPPPACVDGSCAQPSGLQGLLQHHQKKKQSIANHFAKKDPGKCGEIQLSPMPSSLPLMAKCYCWPVSVAKMVTCSSENHSSGCWHPVALVISSKWVMMPKANCAHHSHWAESRKAGRGFCAWTYEFQSHTADQRHAWLR